MGIVLPTLKTESVNFLGLTNSATKFKDGFFRCGGLGFRGRTGKPYKVGNRIKGRIVLGFLRHYSFRIEAIGFPTFGLLL